MFLYISPQDSRIWVSSVLIAIKRTCNLLNRKAAKLLEQLTCWFHTSSTDVSTHLRICQYYLPSTKCLNLFKGLRLTLTTILGPLSTNPTSPTRNIIPASIAGRANRLTISDVARDTKGHARLDSGTTATIVWIPITSLVLYGMSAHVVEAKG